MELRTLQRVGGFALGAGGVLIAAYSISFSVLFPGDALVRDMAGVVVQPAWLALGWLAMAAILLLMLGYSRRRWPSWPA